MDYPLASFLRQCEALTSKKVKLTPDLLLAVQRAHVGGWIPALEATTAFKDEVVVIVRSLDSQAMLVEKCSNKNPVVGRDSTGLVFRLHDEWRDIEAHVMRLVP